MNKCKQQSINTSVMKVLAVYQSIDLFCKWIGFCIMGTSVMKDSRRSSSTYTDSLFLHAEKLNLIFLFQFFFSTRIFGLHSFEFTLSTFALVAAVVRRMLKTQVTPGNISRALSNLTNRLIFTMFKDSSSLPMFTELTVILSLQFTSQSPLMPKMIADTVCLISSGSENGSIPNYSRCCVRII